ncbi:MAG: translation initiation factor IF-3 [Candidatus Lernaella stagnicola]|nr:translation initiation factor IF-3 [Candidatus Lernaella stagnicola]
MRSAGRGAQEGSSIIRRRPRRGIPVRTEPAHRINERIRHSQVLVIDDEGETLGVMDPRDGIEIALEKGLDLVEVAPNGKPPVCKIMDYGRFKYQQEKKAQESKKHATVIQLKEIKMRPKTGEHDYQFKLKKIRQFLEKGMKVKATIMFRGREVVHSGLGRSILLRIAEDVTDVGEVERAPKMEGRNMFLILASKQK